MGYSSQSGQVILGIQSGPGVARTDLATTGLSLRLTSGALAGNRELLIPDAEIGGGRDRTKPNLGPVNFSGDYEMYVRLRAIALLLKGVLGLSSSTAGSGAAAGSNTHVITPVDGQIPFFTIYEEISNNLDRYQYVDAVVNSLHLECDAGGYFTATAGMLGRLMTAGVTGISGGALQDNGDKIVGTNIQIKLNGVTIPAKSFSLDINNNVADDDYRLGSFFMGDMIAKQREIGGSMSIRHEDKSLMRQALFGKPTATQIGGEVTVQNMQIIATTYSEVVAGTYGSLTLDMPEVVLNPFAFEPSGDDEIENDVEFTVIKNVAANKIVTATIINSSLTVS